MILFVHLDDLRPRLLPNTYCRDGQWVKKYASGPRAMHYADGWRKIGQYNGMVA